MTARVLLFVQGPDDARPKCAGGTSVDPYGPLSFHGGPLTKLAGGRWGSSVQAIAQRRAARWWLVECENADAGRAIIAERGNMNGQMESDLRGECEGPAYDNRYPEAGRILASGGANKEVAR